MFNQADFQKIKEIIEAFFKELGFQMEIEIKYPQELNIPIKIKMKEPQILIGEKGKTLAETQHLLKAILKRNIKKPFYIDLDINNYKEKKIKYLKELARLAADEVSLSRKEKQLVPMPAYERRVIHIELSNRSDIETKSVGQEPKRRVIVKPQF